MQTVYVNVDCASIYEQNSYKSAIVTQAVLWEKLTVIERDLQFTKVICEDGYPGWISNYQINTVPDPAELKMITTSHAPVYEEQNEQSAIVREAGAGCYIAVLNKNEAWFQTFLPDGQKGWIKTSAIQKMSGEARRNVTHLASRFMGIPYFWGGKTVKGLDCSGFIQLLFKLAGIKIRRDSAMQFEDARPVSKNFLDGKAGDLLFFAESGDTITHVALKLNDHKIMHARGMVKINNLDENSEYFDKQLKNTFVAVKTFFK